MTDQGLRDALEKLADELDSNNVVMVAGRALRDLLTAHPAEPVGVSDEAVEAAWRTYNTSKSGGGPGGMRAALEAAAPLMGATIRGIRSRDSSNQGMRDALENLASESIPLNGVRWISAREVEKLLAAHPADPAEPVGVCTCPPHANPEYSTPGDWDPNCPVHFPVPAEPVGVSDEAVTKALAEYLAENAAGAERDWAMRVALEAVAPLLGTRPQPTPECAELEPHGPHQYATLEQGVWRNCTGTRPALDRVAMEQAYSEYVKQQTDYILSEGEIFCAGYKAASSAVRPLPTREQIAEALHKAMDHPNSEHCPITETGWHQCGYIDQCNGLADAVLALMGGAEGPVMPRRCTNCEADTFACTACGARVEAGE